MVIMLVLVTPSLLLQPVSLSADNLTIGFAGGVMSIVVVSTVGVAFSRK
jgi:hypothetical protein